MQGHSFPLDKVNRENPRMPKRSHPLTLGCWVDDREQARIDAAARLRGLTRSEYVRAVVIPASERDLRDEVAATEGKAQG